jgi:hypothetical protein
MLQHAGPALRYRTLTDIVRVGTLEVPRLQAVALAVPQAIRLAVTQGPGGIWNDALLTAPSGRAESMDGIGTITAVRRLLEYGWDRDTPPVNQSRRILFRLLAEDEDPSFLFELRGAAGKDPDLIRRGRRILRESAAAALAQAGYEGDPRLRGAAHRILSRIDAFLCSPLAAKPWIRVGNQHVLAPEAAPPSIQALTMLAHMPLFRSEHHVQVDRIYKYVSQAMPRQEAQQLVGSQVVSQPHFVLGDWLPNRSVADADVPSALFWLELMARLGLLRRNDGWGRLFERFLDDRDRDFVWHPHKGIEMPATMDAWVWPTFPLESGDAGEHRWTDVTFRLGLIAKLSGRPIVLV